MNNYQSLRILAVTLISAGSLNAAPLLQLGENTSLHLLGDVSFAYDDNLFLQSTQTLEDSYVEFTPGLELSLASEAAASATLRYQHRFTRYTDYSDLDEDYSDLNFAARYNSGVILTTFNASYREVASKTFDIDTAGDIVGLRIDRNETDLEGSLRYEISELTAAKGAVEYAQTDYAGAGYYDEESTTVPLTFFYKVRPKTELTAGIRYRTTEVSGQMYYEFEDFYYFVGAVGEVFSPVWFADVSIGYQERNSKEYFPDDGSVTYSASLIYSGNPKGTAYVALAQDYRNSALIGNSYVYTSGTLGANYSLTNSAGLSGSISYGQSDYDESQRAEDIFIVRLGANYRANDYLTLRADYSYQNVDRDDAADYDNNEIRVTASLRY